MKISEKASWAVDQLVASGMDTSAKNHRRIEDMFVRLMEEQDMLTRQACAAAVNRIALDHKTIMKAHSTIMNTKAI